MATLPSPTQVAGEQFKLFESWYNKLDPKATGSISAGVAAQFLKKSGLNDNLLSRIWDLSDPGGKGYLDKAGLFVALKLVALVQNGQEPNLADINSFTSPPNMGEAPPHPPPPLPKSPGPPLVPAPPVPTVVNNSGVWTITPSDRARYDQIFNSLGPEANKIHGNKVRGVMINSKLPTDALSKIWDLADMDKDGSLDRVEFSIAMHLIYKVLENNQLPVVLPQDMLSSARRAGVAAQGPVPAPLAPPQALIMDNSKLQSSGPPPAPWVVTAADKARYDVMFHNADLDKDGFVSGQEIKGVFLQSGLPQMVLAHIWNLCDMKQTGKLTSEQFALAMWLIQQKIAGVDPPSSLTPEMIPPTMRPKPAIDPPVVAKPSYSNPELQAVADEIEELSRDKIKLETEIQQKEASMRLKNNEAKNLQTELDTLSATLKQLENQKGAAQKRLDDLGLQKRSLDRELQDLQEQIILATDEVEALRTQVEEQETSLKSQEEEVLSKQRELNDLRAQEMELEASVLSMKNKIEQLTSTQQETLLYLSQVKTKMQELQDQEHHMTEVITSFDAVISAGDASILSESALYEVHPNFNDEQYMAVGPQTPTEKDALSPVLSPVKNPSELNDSEATTENQPKAKDTSFIGGQDPFAQAFGGNAPADPFASWDSSKANAAPPVPTHVDPFGGDAFAPHPATTSPPPVPAAPTTTKPSKSKPPPRPAPPKTRPAKPPPPQINSNNNPTSSDPFGGSSWGDATSKDSKGGKSGGGGFADFANFAEFDSKYSSTSFPLSSSSASSSHQSPWGDDKDPFSGSTARPHNHRHPSPTTRGKFDPFEDSFSGSVSPHTHQLLSTSSPHSPSSTPNWGQSGTRSGASGFGSENESEVQLETSSGGAADPFGGDYDPFKDSRGIKEADEFSWDDEEGETPFSDGALSDSGVGSVVGGKDPFTPIDFSPQNKAKNALNVTCGPGVGNNILGLNQRSKSALGDPSFSNLAHKQVPTRSKTALGQPGSLDIDFDPLAIPASDFSPAWKSNEDLLNENFITPTQGSITVGGGDKLSGNSPFGTNFVAREWAPALSDNSMREPPNNQISYDASDNLHKKAAFRTRGDIWTSDLAGGGRSGPESSSNNNNIKAITGREQADIDLAIALSRSLVETPSAANVRSPSTGL